MSVYLKILNFLKILSGISVIAIIVAFLGTFIGIKWPQIDNFPSLLFSSLLVLWLPVTFISMSKRGNSFYFWKIALSERWSKISLSGFIAAFFLSGLYVGVKYPNGGSSVPLNDGLRMVFSVVGCVYLLCFSFFYGHIKQLKNRQDTGEIPK